MCLEKSMAASISASISCFFPNLIPGMFNASKKGQGDHKMFSR